MKKAQYILILSLTFLQLNGAEDIGKVIKFDTSYTVASGDEGEEAKKFRTCQFPYDPKELSKLDNYAFKKVPGRDGLDTLKASGSGQFTEKELIDIKKRLPKEKRLVVVDLRMETHGFVDGVPISYYAERNQLNVGKEVGQIEKEEADFIKKLMQMKGVEMIMLGKRESGREFIKEQFKSYGKHYETERELVERYGFEYKRFFILDHHRPDEGEVDRFVEFVRGVDENTWLHFHCKGGKGRTTSFMIMYDMLHNADELKMEEIVKRHNLLKGSDLMEFSQEAKSLWKLPAAYDRLWFLKYFYEYARAKDGYIAGKSWSKWLDARAIDVPYNVSTTRPGDSPF